MVMNHMADRLRARFRGVRVVDTAADGALSTLARAARACLSIPGNDVAYIAVKAGNGMWLNVAAALVARMSGARVLLHHHSYSYLHNRTARLAALSRAAGPDSVHIVLARSMAAAARTVLGPTASVIVLNNAGLVDGSLLAVPLRPDGAELVLGHLSNLYLDKGIAEVVDLAVALNETGTRVRLIVAGPVAQRQCGEHLNRAARELGDLFDYRGPVTGSAKRDFFSEITHFVFPSSYLHESVPLVLYEAMASGAVCLSTRRGSIPEQVAGTGAVLAERREGFVAAALGALAGTSVSHAESARARAGYLRSLDEFGRQLQDLVELAADAAAGNDAEGVGRKPPLPQRLKLRRLG